MDHTHILLTAAAIAIGVLVVLRWIFAPQRKSLGAAPHAPRPSGAGDAWNGAARRRRDLTA